ncbi:sigma factor [Mycobacterium montefiorense]|uniref:DNA-directed RNA polymerase sigma-70 factor n=1 Tax=Mycobacterium montefiorense TaxID=154654 RepID=A0AA37PKR1_9MYCO|nr:sigma factor [Mycobacterium montefiorense]GBG39222.1 DNA-directed RNA polymerase sigma-70 factor [Mycobacterium montefiorense]GKU37305.1 DNA-directed RNA polymerase sigma-70 factor [Mycobacterium montefiorense]GKU41953.1 DNA-directed RNA polymerase sigma-70 factor [Mycobacterium montefiorense]GKU45585.1 DNA-directed RNA polymerase sigma-70 factor [Mycobacterium montefiorense]GKU53453.1 DNA-directed RNA polymerase sigma-70 factor [Mycobacterium montefiorense]
MSATKNRADLADLAQRFDADRQHLRAVAFRLLGSIADADDAVQSAWLKASRAAGIDGIDGIDNLTGWFTTITAHEAFDQLRARKRRAEQPLADAGEFDRLAATAPADEDVLLAETIGEVLDRSPAAAKKLASRARSRLHQGTPAQPGRLAQHLEVVEAFLAASRGGDIATLLELLAPDVVRRVDRLLIPDDVPAELRGAREVAEETRRFATRARRGVVMMIDGVPGVVIAPRGRAQILLRLGIGAANRIHAIDISADTDQLHRAVLALPPGACQADFSPIGYQGHETWPAGSSAMRREREHDAR